MTESQLLRSDRADGVVTLTLNRPDQYNALSEALLARLAEELERLTGDPAARIVVIEGAGRAFCAGHDLKEMMREPDEAYYRDLFTRCSHVMSGVVKLAKPVIAKVHGLATAAGCQLVAACDLAVASDSARFAVSGIGLGLFCSTPSVALSRNVSRKKAFEMLMTGDFIDAEDALRHGLVNQVVEASALDAAVDALCTRILRHPPVAVALGKRLFYEQLERSLDGAYEMAAERMACNMMAEDTLEGIQAFMDKREPHWPHRR